MGKISKFETKEQRMQVLLDRVDEEYKDLINLAETHVRQMNLKTDNGGTLSEQELDDMFVYFAMLSEAGIREKKQKNIEKYGK